MSLRAYYDGVLELASEVGRALLVNGAEIYRTEESIARILQCYQVDTGEVFVLPGCIIVSARTPDGHSATRVRRITQRSTDIYLLEHYNDLCRSICKKCPPLEEALAQVVEIKEKAPTHSHWMILLGYFMVCAGFTYVFSLDIANTICGGICGVVMGVALFAMDSLQVNVFFKNILGAAVGASLAGIMVYVGWGHSSALITIGSLMVLFPGVALTSAMRDIMAGDMMSGITKIGEVILIGCAIALGAGVGMGCVAWMTGVL